MQVVESDGRFPSRAGGALDEPDEERMRCRRATGYMR